MHASIDGYAPQWVNGLPTSLLAMEGKTTAVIALMHRTAGLNRRRRKSLEASVGHLGEAPPRFSNLTETDWAVLSCYMSGQFRFDSFWVVASSPHAYIGRERYAHAVEFQLLAAYEEAWLAETLDEVKLAAACPVWPQMRKGVVSSPNVKASKIPLGIFMLWLRLIDDLGQFEFLNEARRTQVAHAVFALSSVGRTEWFIDEAIRLCPVLVDELGRDARLQTSAKVELTSIEASEAASPAIEETASTWRHRVARLKELADRIKEHATRADLDELVALSLSLQEEALSKSNARSLVGELAFHRQELMAFLGTLASKEAFSWLDEDVLRQIDARWTLAMPDSDDAVAVERLAIDARDALSRSQEAADALLAVASEVEQAREQCEALEDALAAANGFAEKTAIRRRQAEAKQRHFDAESVQHGHQEQLVHAASPFGEIFDFDTDYAAHLLAVESAVPVALMIDNESCGESHATPELPVPPGTSDLEPPSAVVVQAEGAAPPIPVTIEPTNNAQTMLETVQVIEDTNEEEPVEGEATAVAWNYLAKGEPGLAAQAARWLGDAWPASHTAAVHLLAAAAFAEELVIPDGALQAALTSRFEQVELSDFSREAPAPWHAAVNLLLAASTLRPMVLAPNSGAGSVAASLHLDGDYQALYALVQKLRELSTRLIGFRIDTTVLRRARGEAATKTELEDLQRKAKDWLRTQAPAYTIRYAPATAVWKQWLRSDGVIESLVSPVIHHRVEDVGRVRDDLLRLSDPAQLQRSIHDTDRKVLGRRRGVDIHASAFDHLVRLVDEALALPRQWITLVELLGGDGGRLRALLEEVRTVLRAGRDDVERELTRPPSNDAFGMVAACQKQALKALHRLCALFDSTHGARETERSPNEALSRACLLVPTISVSETYQIDTEPTVALEATKVPGAMLDAPSAQRARMDRGDILGAELMGETGWVTADLAPLRQERERWRLALRREIGACREVVEIGSAYGYLQDADRADIESQLARHEAHLDDEKRFDVALADIRRAQARIESRREERKREVRMALDELVLTEETRTGADHVEKALDEGDIATAHELLHWLQQGKPTAVDSEDDAREGFKAFFPTSMRAIDGWLDGKRPEVVQQTLMQGLAIAGMEGPGLGGAQCRQAAEMFGHWADMKARREIEERRLKDLMTGLGFTVHGLAQSERVSGREVWTLEAAPIADRHICTLPVFGSAAAGRYRVICVWGRPTEDEFLQWVGDPSMSRPTLLLYFDRMIERKWRNLARMSKAKRRAFLFLDETLLVYLCGASGSRLRTWFDTALPFSYSLPYDATAGLVPPEMFYGRSEELEAVRTADGRCFIYGGRQLGKTALLKRAEQSFHDPQRGHYARWVDLRAEGIGVSTASSEIWRVLHERFSELGVIDPNVPAPAPGKRPGENRVLKAVREFLIAYPDRRILLLLDEADRFFEQDGRRDFEETRRLKQLMDDTQRRFKVVFAGLHNVLRMTGWAGHEWANHPLAHFGEPIEIGPLREGTEVEEAIDLIRKPMEAAGFQFEARGLIIRILAQTNYYPSLIQLYCSHLLKHMLAKFTATRAQPEKGPRYVVTSRDIELVYSSDALREEIRAKFRLTLQLDPRYEVLAYAMALSLLRGEYSQREGMSWQAIREDCALRWWAEGFNDTSETSFRVLLDEMRGLGVLSRSAEGRYALRSANVLLLLGTQDEIETVLYKDREPAVEFELTSFRPPMRAAPHTSLRSIFTYQQLSQLLLRQNFITVVTGNEAAGIGEVALNLRDYLGSGELPAVLTGCADRASFGFRLQHVLGERKDQVSLFVVPETMPWTDLWLEEAQARLNNLRSNSRLVSILFVAEPATLWRLLRDDEAVIGKELPWMPLLHWNDGFLRHWLDECQLQLEPEERGRLAEVTGLWPGLINLCAGDQPSLRTLRQRLDPATDWPGDEAEYRSWRTKLGLDVAEPTVVLRELARWGEPLTADDLATLSEATSGHVQACLYWAELLGLARRDSVGYWTLDPIATRVLRGLTD